MRLTPSRLLRALTGLRPRLLAAMLLTSAVTLGVAALTLLSPLEQRLREDGMRRVLVAIGATRPEFREVVTEGPHALPNGEEVKIDVAHLARRSGGAQITILKKGDLEPLYAPQLRNLNVPDYYAAARRALATGAPTKRVTEGSLIVVQRVRIASRHYALIVIKHLEYVAMAVGVVQTAFIAAAAAGLAIALLLGAGLASTMLRRLERLRRASREMERRGLEAPLPQVSGHDEIGELARAFAGMQRQLRRQEAARRAFLATASHELRTPLASLEGMLELLEEDLQGGQPDLEDARIRTTHAREQSRRLSQLAGDLLDLSRLDAEMTLRREPLELGELTRAVAAEFERAAAKREVRIAVSQPPAPCWAAADPGAVARIVRILIDNALRFAPPGSGVRVLASNGSDLARVQVSDEGPGVPAPERERIFERFTRGSATAGQSGFGLGLAIGRELAVRMGGSLELLDGESAARPAGESAARPAGASFALSLPASAAEEMDE